MTKESPKRPTDAELEILRILWKQGPSTVRQVYHTINQYREAGYTTVLKFMQIMTDKGLLTRDRSVRPQVYSAVHPEGRVQRQLVADLLERAFAGSPGSLVMQALYSKKTSHEEREMIRALLDQLEEEAP